MTRLFLSIFALVALFTTKTFAQEDHRFKNEKLANELNLSEAQRKALKDIKDEAITKKRALLGKSRLESKAIRAERNSKVKEVLTPEQYTKWEALAKDKHQCHYKNNAHHRKGKNGKVAPHEPAKRSGE